MTHSLQLLFAEAVGPTTDSHQRGISSLHTRHTTPKESLSAHRAHHSQGIQSAHKARHSQGIQSAHRARHSQGIQSAHRACHSQGIQSAQRAHHSQEIQSAHRTHRSQEIQSAHCDTTPKKSITKQRKQTGQSH